ncbi:MAG: hypothetical protein ACLFMZ_09660 [Spirochaetaceae bacterium]
MDIQEDFAELFELLNRYKVKYIIVGGLYGQVPVNFLGKQELLRNKRTTARYKDLADIEALGENPEG